MTQLLVYESKPLNAAVFDRLADVELREVRSLMQLTKAIREKVPPIVAIEVTGQKNLVTVGQLVRSIKLDHPSTAVICMPLPAVRTGTCWLYEAGTDLIFRSMLDRDRVACLIRAAAKRHQPAETQANSVRERTFAAIPWKRHAT